MQLGELDFAARLLVWAAREWIQIRDPSEPRAARLVEAFEHAGVPGAIERLDAMLGTLATIAQRRLDFRCPCDVTLGRDEQRMLDVLGSLQAAHRHAAAPDVEHDQRTMDVLYDWVGLARTDGLRRQLAGVAAEFAAAGLRFRPEYPPTQFRLSLH